LALDWALADKPDLVIWHWAPTTRCAASTRGRPRQPRQDDPEDQIQRRGCCLSACSLRRIGEEYRTEFDQIFPDLADLRRAALSIFLELSQ
jgi:hypothetical protein